MRGYYLTPEEEVYCLARVAGKTLFVSYLEAFGGTGIDDTDRRKASVVDRRLRVQNRIRELRVRKETSQLVEERAINRAVVTAASALSIDKYWVMKKLVANTIAAEKKKNFSAVRGFLELIGTELGMFIKKVEVDKKQTLDEFLSTLDLPQQDFKRVEDGIEDVQTLQ